MLTRPVNACRSGYKVLCITLLDMLRSREAAKLQGVYEKTLRHYSKYALLIIDEFLLFPVSPQEEMYLYEVIDARYGQASTIVCSQLMPEGWHGSLGGNPLAESILDRLTSAAYSMSLEGSVSMRKHFSPI
ncbi:ATP-binding protein [Oscillospiraceae bacterium HV4-5-C5C]|nr:ATP-binding protein [Oscillospiraceae bacterium HV4-5-C5C]